MTNTDLTVGRFTLFMGERTSEAAIYFGVQGLKQKNLFQNCLFEETTTELAT